MERDLKTITLDGMDLSSSGGEQKDRILDLVREICSDFANVSRKKFDICVKLANLYEIVGRGSFEIINERYFDLKLRTARRYLSIGRTFGPHREAVGHIGFSDLGKLAEQTRLSSLCSELISEMQRGEKPDGNRYKEKIKEISPDEDEDSPEQNGSNDAEHDGEIKDRSRSSHKHRDMQQGELDEDAKNLVDELIPQDPDEQGRLLEILSTNQGRKRVTKYLETRLAGLVNNRGSDTHKQTSRFATEALTQ